MEKINKIKILLADDHPVVRIGVRSELEKNKDFVVIAEAKTGREAILKSIKLKPDIILLDISMPDINGLEAASVIIKKNRHANIIVLSMINDESYVEEILKHGAKGYVLKDSPTIELFKAIRKVLKGEKYLDKTLRENIKNRKYKTKSVKISVLTKREVEILRSIAEGISNKSIADKFFISVRTVEVHRDKIKKKLSMQSVAELTRYAMANNLILEDIEIPHK